MTQVREDALRPQRMTDFAGQPELTPKLKIVLDSAREREQLPDHMLLFGPPGLGKTTLAHIIGAELALPVKTLSGPALERPADITSVLTGLQSQAVVFIDEIHRLPRPVEEHLYSAMEDGVLDVQMGEGPKARTVRLPLKPFVLVGATTQSGSLSAPLRDRFGFHGRLRLYDDQALADIVTRSAHLMSLDVSPSAALEIASRSRGTPRIANRNLRRVRDVAQVRALQIVDGPDAAAALEEFDVDPIGLDSLGRELLRKLVEQFGGGPVGGDTLARSVNETLATLEEVYEPFLMHKGLLQRTSRGRIATPAAYRHLGVPHPADSQA